MTIIDKLVYIGVMYTSKPIKVSILLRSLL